MAVHGASPSHRTSALLLPTTACTDEQLESLAAVLRELTPADWAKLTALLSDQSRSTDK